MEFKPTNLGFPSTQEAQSPPVAKISGTSFRNQSSMVWKFHFIAAKNFSLGEDTLPYCLLLRHVGLWEAIAIEVLMSSFDQHALSTLLEQQRYEEIAPQLDEEELRVCEQYTAYACKAV